MFRAGAAQGVKFQIWRLVRAAWGPGQGRQHPVALISRLCTAGGEGRTGTVLSCPIGSALNSELCGTKASFLGIPGIIPNLHSQSLEASVWKTLALDRVPLHHWDWEPGQALRLYPRQEPLPKSDD